MSAVLGVFAGGASRRMGRPKALLRRGGVTLLERACRLGGALGLETVVVGRRPELSGLGRPVLEDDPPGVGPLGGLRALLRHADGAPGLALACDMPFVDADDLRLLLEAEGTIAAPRRDGRWEPLCARYGPGALPLIDAQLAAGRRALQTLLDAADTRVVDVPPDHLVDWDAPEDIEA